MATQTVVEKVIRIDVVASAQAQANINALATSVKKVETATDQMQKKLNDGFDIFGKTVGRAVNVLGALGVATGIGEITRTVLEAASAYQVLESRLKLVLGSQEKANTAVKDIIKISSDTGREIDGTAKLYEKASRAAQAFGISQASVTQITKGFAESIRLSGSSTQEAYAAMVQFGQALASGRLQGDEFRSLMENNSVFMYAFADAAGKSVTELRKMGSEGKLSAKFLFDTMLKEGVDGLNMLQRLERQAASVPLTFRQSFESLSTQATAFIGETTKLLSGVESGDKDGMFGPIIRSLDTMVAKLREARELADAKGDGLFGRIAAFLKTVAPYLSSGAYVIPGMQGIPGLVNKALGNKTPEQQRIDASKDVAEALRKEETAYNRLYEAAAKYIEKDQEIPGLLQRAVDNSFARVQALKNQQSALLELEEKRKEGRGRGVPFFSGVATQKEVDPEAEKEAARRMKELTTYIEKLQDAYDAEKRLASGRADSSAEAKEEVVLLRLLKENGMAVTSDIGKRAMNLIAETKAMENHRDNLKDLARMRADEVKFEADRRADLDDQIKRDEAAIDALKNKSKATQEYTTALLEEQIAKENLKLIDSGGNQQEIQNRIDLIEKLNKALQTRKDLVDAQDADKLDKEAEKQRKKEETAFEDMVTKINKSIVNGIGAGGNVGENLAKNIKDTLRDEVFEISVSVLTEPFARQLASMSKDLGELVKSTLEQILAQVNIGELLSGVGSFFSSAGGSIFGSIASFFGFANGGIMTPNGPMQLRKYSAGGIADSPQIAMYGEGSRSEAFVPLDDGRSIPVTVKDAGRPSISVVHAPTINIDARADQAQVYEIASTASYQANKELIKQLEAAGVL